MLAVKYQAQAILTQLEANIRFQIPSTCTPHLCSDRSTGVRYRLQAALTQMEANNRCETPSTSTHGLTEALEVKYHPQAVLTHGLTEAPDVRYHQSHHHEFHRETLLSVGYNYATQDIRASLGHQRAAHRSEPTPWNIYSRRNSVQVIVAITEKPLTHTTTRH